MPSSRRWVSRVTSAPWWSACCSPGAPGRRRAWPRASSRSRTCFWSASSSRSDRPPCPTVEHLLVGLALLLLIPLKSLGFAVLLRPHGLRRRTSVLPASTLGNFSEFGLIVAVAARTRLGEPWPVVLATTVAASFVLSALVEQPPDGSLQLAHRWLPDRPPERLHADDRPIEVGDAQAVVLGMGRVGRAAYTRLVNNYGLRVIGVESRCRPARRAGGRGAQCRRGRRDRSGLLGTDPPAPGAAGGAGDALPQQQHQRTGRTCTPASSAERSPSSRSTTRTSSTPLSWAPTPVSSSTRASGSELADTGAAEAGLPRQESP